MPDFKLRSYQSLLQSLLSKGFSFQTFSEFLANPDKVVILRHDVDLCAANSLKTAKIESDLGIKGSFYFRIIPQSNNPGIIREIASMDHEIGYHYEDLALCKGNMEDAIRSFEKNLKYFRHFYPVKTICMHGSPLSKYDNRKLWEKYDYRDFGIVAEPYFDVDYTKVLYLTDTGRRWDGEAYSVRDKVKNSMEYGGVRREEEELSSKSSKSPKSSKSQQPDNGNDRATSRLHDRPTDLTDLTARLHDCMTKQTDETARLHDCKTNKTSELHDYTTKESPLPWHGDRWDNGPLDKKKKMVSRDESGILIHNFHSTFDIIRAAEENLLPDQIMITVHPQRWTNNPILWTKELVMQNVKNQIKRVIISRK